MTRPLRVLCLHGYTQNGQTFRDRMGPFRRSLKRTLDPVFITAPHEATEFQPESKEASESRAWWNRSGDVWAETAQSVRFIHRVMRDAGPFDGIVGFSQGSGMAAILMALMQAAHTQKLQNTHWDADHWDADLRELIQELADCPLPKFAMLFAGFYPELPQFDVLVREPKGCKINVPTLHMVGQTDAIVPMERGQLLATQAFVDAQLRTHEGGHFVPGNAAWRKQYQEFIDGLDLQR
ncbi:Family of serine hydrolases 3 [Coemansia sp. RSA 1822]|nr:Family of serine hydrolases 3 [Coemansia sp. RSA 638]KAJ2542147.1 Family of serine hydrolases 3 [Coemansia sp. RSA 1853]KAJ2564175.1 Family of serine hydrolases 3 [Coemansia sp. RSA 1822]